MSLVALEAVERFRGARRIFGPVTVTIDPGAQIGLIGPNGAGKTTLLRLITGADEPDAGCVRRSGRSLGYLRQEEMPRDARSLWEEACLGVADVFEMRDRLRALEEEIARSGEAVDDLLIRYGRLREAFERAGGYEAEARVRAVLFGLGFTERDIDRPARTLSGGEQARLSLARLLLSSPDLLLLDEPTNHLDIGGVEWLEGFLRAFPGAYVLVSHDRYLLDRTVDRIWELDTDGFHTYRGNFSQAQAQRLAARAQRQAAFEAQQEEIRRIESFVERFRAGTRATQAKSRIRRLEAMERIEAPAPDARAGPVVRFALPGATGREVVRLESVGHRFGPRRLFGGLDLSLARGERIALLGANGAGKSTLLRILAGEIEPFEGSVHFGRDVAVGYFAQQRVELDPRDSVLDSVLAVRNLTANEARTHLGRFRFVGDDVFKSVKALSGGERSRLALARLVLSPCSLLLLDEPTNHLVVHVCEALEEALLAYPGTLVFVSHDRWFIERLAQSSLVFANGRVRRVDGGYEAYRHAVQSDAADAKAPPNRPRRRSPKSHPAGEAKQPDAELESKIEQLERQKGELEDRLADPSLYADRGEAERVAAEHAALEKRIEALYAEWTAQG